MKTLLILLCLLHILPAHSSAPLVHFRIKMYDSRTPDDDYIRRGQVIFYSMHDKKVVLTTAPHLMQTEWRDSLPAGRYTMRYENIMMQEIEREITISPTDTTAITIALDSLKSYTPSAIDELKDGDQIVILYYSQGCNHEMYRHVVITRSKQDFVVALYQTLEPPALYSLKPPDGKLIKKLRKHRNEIAAYDRFESELLSVPNQGGCTTLDHYQLICRYRNAERTDGGCSWQGFPHLVEGLFGSDRYLFR